MRKALFILATAIAVLAIATDAASRNDAANWEAQARARKARYTFLESAANQAIDSADVAFALAKYAVDLAPDDVFYRAHYTPYLATSGATPQPSNCFSTLS